MNPSIKLTILASAMLMALQTYANTEKLQGIEVNPNLAETHSTNTQQLLEQGNSETGGALRAINGVNATRMGGHGLDIVIHGQKHSQVNVLLDGAKIEGGCPNRMDPPTSYAELSSYDSVTVLKGVSSLQYGAGGSGGTVLFERDQPAFDPQKPFSGKVSVGASNVMKYEADAEVEAVAKQGYLRLQGASKEANDYQDGNGDTVNASYQTNQASLDIGWTPSENHHLKLSYEISETEDAKFPGAGMDTPETSVDMTRLQYQGKEISPAIDEIEVEAYRSNVSHKMNNFSLRTTSAAQWKETPTETTSIGLSIKATSLIADSEVIYGVQTDSIEQTATLYNMDPTKNGPELNFMWPDVTTNKNSVFAETITPLHNDWELIAGIRYDQIAVTADRADQKPSASQNVPTSVYAENYDNYSSDTDKTENNFNGLIRLEQQLSRGYYHFAGISHTVRTADATERFMAKKAIMKNSQGTPVKNQSWVGNPDLAPEKHNQLDLGIGFKNNQYKWLANVWYDQVEDYILRDQAKNQLENGIKSTAASNDNREIYLNKDATLYGLDVEFAAQLSKQLSIQTQASYSHGYNDTDKRNLAYMPPISGNLSSVYLTHDWYIGGRGNFSLAQDRIDEQYTPEANHGKTAAWTTIDVYGAYNLSKHIKLQAGIDNLTDRAYYSHLSKDPVDGSTYKNNEPGRNIWAKLSAEF